MELNVEERVLPEEAAAELAGAAAEKMTEAVGAAAAMESPEPEGQTPAQPDPMQLRRTLAQARMRQAFMRLWQQAEALKKIMPNFDLDLEMQDPRFAQLVHPSVGLDVETAFQVAHRQELEPLMLRYATQQAAQRLAQTVAAGQARPPENGAAQEAVAVQDDPRLWSPQQRADLRERVRKGERVVL